MPSGLVWLAIILLICAIVWGTLGLGGFIQIAFWLLMAGIVILIILFIVALIAGLLRR
ncbi:MAG: DUF1328 domain-containing protein [Halobacteriota archaeon]